MQLKKVVVCGFKSFADKTEFEIPSGITVVVGPNGCGKSNVVDAIKWVLGEQSAKSLRGGHMLDVIFNGSNSRKSTSYAEVTLSFAGTRGVLNGDLDEVAVTRKLHRSGESEYLINNQPARLKDIKEMFMDTGVGADAYSIIEQGRVEMLLQASKQDRRAIFEEAAGISKYKARKKEALRKLERTEQNLLRLTDIVAELEKQLRSIRYQAGKARNYQSYVARLKELRLSQFLTDYYNLQQDSGRLEGELTGIQDELIGVNTAAEKAQARLSLLDHQLDALQQELLQTENQLVQCTAEIGKQEDRIESGHRRTDELQALVTRGTQQLQTLRKQVAQLQAEIAADEQQIEDAQKLLAEQQDKLRVSQEERQQGALELAEYRAQLDDEKSGMIDIVRRTAQLHNEINSLDHRRNNLEGQKDRLSDRSGKISAEVEQLLTNRAQTDEKLKEIKALLADSQKQFEAKRQQLAQISSERVTCSENLSAAKEYRSGLLSRQQLLQSLEAKLEGVDQGVRQILQARARDASKFPYISGMVAEIIRADVKYAAIIEAALAHAAQDLVAENSAEVLADTAALDELKGRVRFICLDRLPVYVNNPELNNCEFFSSNPKSKIQNPKSEEANPQNLPIPLVNLVTAAPEHEKLAYHLLGRTLLVDSLAAALAWAGELPPGYRFVTMQGEVLEADGTVHLGPQTAQAGLISRKSELRQIATDLAQAQERIAALQDQAAQYASAAQHLEKNLQELRTAIYETNTEEIETRSRLEQHDANINRLKQEQPLIASEIAGLEEQIAESLVRQTASREDLAGLQSLNDERQGRIESLEEVIAVHVEADQVHVERITELKVRLGETQQRRLALVEKRTTTQGRVRQAETSVRSLQTDLDNAARNQAEAQRSILTAESRIAELFMARQEHQETARTQRNQRHELESEKEQLQAAVKEIAAQRDGLQNSLHAAQLSLNEAKLKMENLCLRAKEEICLDLAEHFRQRDAGILPAASGEAESPLRNEGDASADQQSAELATSNLQPATSSEQATPPQAVDWAAVAAEIEDLKGKIERLGNINLDAIAEQDELEKRHEYLATQGKDLLEAKKNLESLIAKINQESETLFRANFEAIKINFAELFRKLFGGGKAEIILENDADILECGIEIIARPPGKQLQSISLMSGGEKTMTAVALLLAIFKSKPSPFCLLDEVDAALDEANNERFNLVVQDFAQTSQFVIITHSRRTMSIADVIYGVTMQEQGVSKKVSVRFTTAGDPDLAEPVSNAG